MNPGPYRWEDRQLLCVGQHSLAPVMVGLELRILLGLQDGARFLLHIKQWLHTPALATLAHVLFWLADISSYVIPGMCQKAC